MTQKTTNIILPILIGCLISLVVYIYLDFKAENKSNIQDIRKLIEVIESNQIEQKIMNQENNYKFLDHDRRLIRIENKTKINN